MQLSEAATLCKNFKGAALSCLILMWATRKERQNWTRDDLASLTGYSRPTTADGLSRLEFHGFVIRIGRYMWQLTDDGFQLSFGGDFASGESNFLTPRVGLENWSDQSESKNLTPEVKNFYFGSSSFKDTHDHEHESFKELLLPPNGVKNFDSPPFRETIFDGLAQQLVSCGCSPKNARDAIVQALSRETSAKEIELRIMWWRAYCAAHPKIDHPGNLIAARVAKGIDKPSDFGIRDIPDRYYELGQQIEDLQREIESS